MSAQNGISAQAVAEEYGPVVSAICRRMIFRRDTAEDAAQEVWVEVLRSLPGFRGEASLSTWIHSIAFRTIRRYTYREKVYSTRFLRELFRINENEGNYEIERIPSEDRLAWIKQSCSDCLTGILHCVDNDSRYLYILRVLTPLSFDALSEIFGQDAAALRQNFSRARRKIHGFLEGQCTLYNPSGTCRCKLREPLLKTDLALEYATVSAFSRSLLFLPRAEKYYGNTDFWKDLLSHT
jgi:RNA polymerase sigma-70 factor (ECF subfamily)